MTCAPTPPRRDQALGLLTEEGQERLPVVLAKAGRVRLPAGLLSHRKAVIRTNMPVCDGRKGGASAWPFPPLRNPEWEHKSSPHRRQ